jgi:O-acetyl-ADP-ribose deacetylase (regulator of RNase III)
MILAYTNASMWELSDREHVMVNPCNLQGIGGAGVSLWFRQHYPKAFAVYKYYCQSNKFHEGDVLLTTTQIECEGEHDVAHLPTKDKIQNSSSLFLMGRGLRTLDEVCQKSGWTIVTTKIGTGLGGLSWNDVEPLLTNLRTSVIIASGRLPQIPSPEHGEGHVLVKERS